MCSAAQQPNMFNMISQSEHVMQHPHRHTWYTQCYCAPCFLNHTAPSISELSHVTFKLEGKEGVRETEIARGRGTCPVTKEQKGRGKDKRWNEWGWSTLAGKEKDSKMWWAWDHCPTEISMLTPILNLHWSSACHVSSHCWFPWGGGVGGVCSYSI